MEIDYKKLYNATEDLLERLVDAKSIEEIVREDYFTDIFAIFRIAAFFAGSYSNPADEKEGKGIERTMKYNAFGEADENRFLQLREITGGGSVVVLKLFQYADDDDWDEDMVRHINTLLRVIFANMGRVSTAGIAYRLTFMDTDLEIYNLKYFMRHLATLVMNGKIGDYSVVRFNLKRFTLVNHNIGRRNGDVVMKKYVHGLQDMLGDKGLVARIGGDNFVVVFYKNNMAAVHKYLTGMGIRYGDKPEEMVIVSASAGAYNIPANCGTESDIMDCVSAAAAVAKNGARDQFVYFSRNLIESQNNSKMIETLFPEAIAKKQFEVYYQPKVELEGLTLAGAEALCRWRFDGKIIKPIHFIPILEQSALICKLDMYILEKVCQDMREWIDKGYDPVRVSVNLSRRNMDNYFIVDSVQEIVDKYSIPHELIEVELTETTTDVDFVDLKRVVSEFKELGFHTAVDDFGIGYSSLNLIREIPWDVLKIDKSFLPAKKDDGETTYQMLMHIISMVQSIGLECIVEGVETTEQLEMLKVQNCSLVQGYYFDKPLACEEFENRLTEGRQYKMK